MKIAFVGFGSLGQQIKKMIDETYQTDIAYLFFDDNLYDNKVNVFHLPFNSYLNAEFSDYNFIVSLGYKHLIKKKDIIKELQLNKRKLFSFIHPTCYISPDSMVENGVIMYPCCVIDQSVSIGTGTILHNRVTISHDSKIADNCYFSPGVIVCGNVTIGSLCFIGAGCIISNNLKIEDEVTIGIGSVVTKNLAFRSNVIGNPLRFLVNKKLRLQ